VYQDVYGNMSKHYIMLGCVRGQAMVKQ